MQCAWQNIIELLPLWMRNEVNIYKSEIVQEIRLRINAPPMIITPGRTLCLQRTVTLEDLQFCVNLASKYSPWSVQTNSQCYITVPGGHRMGLCGSVIVKDKLIAGLRHITSICIRIARDFCGISGDAYITTGSILIIGKPGSGKTTLLRDLVRRKSNNNNGFISVIDERQEIFPITSYGKYSFEIGRNTDILSGCSKSQGIEIALRNMGPSIIAVDEITASEDCDALIHAGWCGVDLFATAHAACKEDLYKRPIYRRILESNLFEHLIVIGVDKSWHIERIGNDT